MLGRLRDTRHGRSIVHFALDLVGSSLDTSGKSKMGREKKDLDLLPPSSSCVSVCPRLPLFSSKKTFTTDDDGSGKGLAQGTSQEEE